MYLQRNCNNTLGISWSFVLIIIANKMKTLELTMAITLRAFFRCAKSGHNKLSLELPFVVPHATGAFLYLGLFDLHYPTCEGLIIAVHPRSHIESTARHIAWK